MRVMRQRPAGDNLSVRLVDLKCEQSVSISESNFSFKTAPFVLETGVYAVVMKIEKELSLYRILSRVPLI